MSKKDDALEKYMRKCIQYSEMSIGIEQLQSQLDSLKTKAKNARKELKKMLDSLQKANLEALRKSAQETKEAPEVKGEEDEVSETP